MVNIVVVGDVHGHFDAHDVASFNQADVALRLFVGDLANLRHRQGLAVARTMAGLRPPTLFIAGNHDTVTGLQLLAELRGARFWIRLLHRGQARRERALRRAMAPVTWAGYSTHSFSLQGVDFDVVAARPLAMGGSQCSYAPYLRQAFGVTGMAESAARLRACVDAARSDRLIFLAHNGPTGLGSTPAAIWGCDFRPQAGDFGDADLRAAVDYAKHTGRRVLAVVAGHMHHRLRGGGRRRWHQVEQGVHYVNAARVPRIDARKGRHGRPVHHHVRLTLTPTDLQVEAVAWPASPPPVP